jgi:hypothetical protein
MMDTEKHCSRGTVHELCPHLLDAGHSYGDSAYKTVTSGLDDH